MCQAPFIYLFKGKHHGRLFSFIDGNNPSAKENIYTTCK